MKTVLSAMDQTQAATDNDADIQRIRLKSKQHRRIVFVSGNFNVVHPGHLRLLRFAAECGDFLVVGVHDQSVPGAILPEELRLDGVKVISLVDYAFVLREPAERFIAKLKPSIVVKGKEHELRHNAELASVESYGGKLLFGSGEISFSSIDLLERDYLETNLSTIQKPSDFPARHDFTIKELKEVVRTFSHLRVAVVGDLIVDDYIECEPLGMSQEDPTIVVTPISTKRFIGGAGIVAAHAKGLGADVQFFTVSGHDETAVYASDTLSRFGVTSTIIQDESRPTTLKQRYRATGKTLLRVSQLRHHDISPQVCNRLFEAIDDAVSSADLVVFSDFNYGCLPQALVDKVIASCRRHGAMIVADSQSSSQIGDISRFKHAKLLTPTEHEARLALHDSNSGLVILAEGLRTKASAENVIVKLGAEGLLVHTSNGNDFVTDQLPAFNRAAKDVAGAGDSLLVCASLALCAGFDIWKSCYVGSLAAACQVARLGNVPLAQADLFTEIDFP